MADVAGFRDIGNVCKLLDKLRPVGLVHVVATEAIRPDEWLPLVGIGDRLTFQVMTIPTLVSRIFLLMVLEFQLSRSPGPVCDMTGIASPIQGRVPTPIFGYIQTG
jgi:hypothetical protein